MSPKMDHAKLYLAEVAEIATKIDLTDLGEIKAQLIDARDNERRLFIVGLGGSAANASHAANDFRKLCGIEAYALTDNVAGLTAIANDEGWEWIFRDQLQASKAESEDLLMVLSVGGGTRTVSVPLVRAMDYADEINMVTFGIIGKKGSRLEKNAVAALIVPAPAERVTPHTEAFQMVLIHLLVSDPELQVNQTKW